jgi:hypothetical protein
MTKRSFQEQLKDLKKALPSEAKTAPKKAPLPKVLPPRAPKSDEELFLDAVEGVDRDAVLKKYDETPPPAPPPKPATQVKREEEDLFKSFVGALDRPVAKKG